MGALRRAVTLLALVLALGSSVASDVASAKACPCWSLLLLADPDPALPGEPLEIKAYLTRSDSGEAMSAYSGPVIMELGGSALASSLTLSAEPDRFGRHVARVRPDRPGLLLVTVRAGDVTFPGPFPVSGSRPYTIEVTSSASGVARAAGEITPDAETAANERSARLVLVTALAAAAILLLASHHAGVRR